MSDRIAAMTDVQLADRAATGPDGPDLYYLGILAQRLRCREATDARIDAAIRPVEEPLIPSPEPRAGAEAEAIREYMRVAIRNAQLAGDSHCTVLTAKLACLLADTAAASPIEQAGIEEAALLSVHANTTAQAAAPRLARQLREAADQARAAADALDPPAAQPRAMPRIQEAIARLRRDVTAARSEEAVHGVDDLDAVLTYVESTLTF